MAGTVGQGANVLGNILIPETMANLRRPGMMEQAQREQQVGGIQAGRLFSGMNQEIGTPQTKSFQVNGKTIGQDNPSTVQPLFSGAKKMAMFSQAFPEQGRALMASQLMEQMNPPLPEVKAYKPGDVVGTQKRDGTFTPTFTVPTEAPKPEVFKPMNMQLPGTDRMVVARTPADFDRYVNQGFVQAGTSVPGQRQPDAPKDTFGDESKLRGEFDTKTKDFVVVRDAAATIQRVANDPSPAGDISLIFSYMKLLDPGSTVREGEYATAQNAASVPESLRAKYKKIMDGETLTAGQREDFVKQANNIYASRLSSFNSEYQRFSDLATDYSVKPSRVVYDRTNGVLPGAIPVPGTPGTAVAGQPQASSIPSSAIDYLKTNPSLAAAFDQKYGAGASKQYLGPQ